MGVAKKGRLSDGARGVPHCAWRHKKDGGINVRKRNYCVWNDTRCGPRPFVSAQTSPWNSSAPPSVPLLRATLPLNKLSSQGPGGIPGGSILLAQQPGKLWVCALACAQSALQETVDPASRNALLCGGWNGSYKLMHVCGRVTPSPLFSLTGQLPAFRLAFVQAAPN